MVKVKHVVWGVVTLFALLLIVGALVADNGIVVQTDDRQPEEAGRVEAVAGTQRVGDGKAAAQVPVGGSQAGKGLNGVGVGGSKPMAGKKALGQSGSRKVDGKLGGSEGSISGSQGSNREQRALREVKDVHQNLRRSSSMADCKDQTFALSPNGPKPDFILIGVAKGGSTSFSNYLPTHPNVSPITNKEPNYFTWKYISTRNYQTMFKNVVPHQGPVARDQSISGEYSTSYILHPLAPRRVHAELPTAKIIMLLRNPIDRAYSHYTMSLRSKLEDTSFEKVVAMEMQEVDELRARFRECFNSNGCMSSECFPAIPMHRHLDPQGRFMIESDRDLKDYFFTSYLFRSIYDDSVERWLSLFPREQVLILKSEDLFENKASVMEEVRQFLELAPFDFTDTLEAQVSWGGGASNHYKDPHSYKEILPETRQLLREFFEPYNQRLYQIIGRDMEWE